MAHERFVIKKKKKKGERSRNRRIKMNELDIAGITFCFHNKTACCKTHLRPVSNDICILTNNNNKNNNPKKKNSKEPAQHRIPMEMKTTLRDCLRSQQTCANNATRSFRWMDKKHSNMFWELVKHNKYRSRIMRNHPKCDATNAHHKCANNERKEKKNKICWKLHVSMEFSTCRPTH